MRTKLLRKVRRRYRVEYYPHTKLMYWIDKNDKTRTGVIEVGIYRYTDFPKEGEENIRKDLYWTYESARKFALGEISRWISWDYQRFGKRRIAKKNFKITLFP